MALQDDFQSAHKIFKKQLIKKNGDALSCSLHSIFKKINPKGHNCLGCNFADSTDLILQYLKRHKQLVNEQNELTTYFLLLYLFVERVEIILNILQVPEEYRKKHFQVFTRINRWANFIKHPKAFIFTHHSTFDYEGSGYTYVEEFSLTMDDTFIDRFYKGRMKPEDQDKNNKELFRQIRNKDQILVLFPNIIHITEKFCFSVKKFYELIENNEVYIDILNDESTLTLFFENESSAGYIK